MTMARRRVRGAWLLSHPRNWPGRYPDLVRQARQVREWPLLATRELVRRHQRSAYHLRGSGLVLHVRHDSDDLAGLQEVFSRRNYLPPPHVLARLRAIAAQRPLRVVDLGGNIGLFPLQVFELFPDAEVVSFEPDPANVALLKATISANGKSAQWHVVEACAGPSSGTVNFLAGRHMESREVPLGTPGSATLPQVDVFDHLDDCDWLKMDIEGGEWAILDDPRFARLQAVAIALEYHPNLCPSDHPREVVLSLLAAAGYQVGDFEERVPDVGELWAWRM